MSRPPSRRPAGEVRVAPPSVRVEAPAGPRVEAHHAPPLAQTYVPIVCPYCGAARPRLRATAPGSIPPIRYYACRSCTDAEGGPSTFKVPVAAVAQRIMPRSSERPAPA